MKIFTLAALAAAALLAPLQASAACHLVTAEVPVTMQGLRPLLSARIGGRCSGQAAVSLDKKRSMSE